MRSILFAFALVLGACHAEAADESPAVATAPPIRIAAIPRIEPRLPDPVPAVDSVDEDGDAATADEADDADEQAPAAAEPDRDSDDIVDVEDRCPGEPEDRDGFEDNDGCPDVDHDVDPVL